MSMAVCKKETCSNVMKALEVAEEYLNARDKFLQNSRQALLGGNDNFIGRIGEFLAMLYLWQYHGLDLDKPRGGETNKSKKAVDLVTPCEKNNVEKWWSVKAITLENKKGKTSIYKMDGEKFPPLIIVRFNATETGIRAECLAYTEGLNPQGGASKEQEVSLSTKKRFAEAKPESGKLELGVFQGDVKCIEKGMWKRLETNTFQGLKTDSQRQSAK